MHQAALVQHSTPKVALNVVIVGCGIAGLSAAYCIGRADHKITVLESASVIGEVGAGIQVNPNLSRLLIRWGLRTKLEEMGVSFLRCKYYDDGQRIGWTRSGESMEQDHGAPYYHIHVATFSFSIACKVVSIDSQAAKVTPDSGEDISGDLIIGADGIKSVAFRGYAAYRAIIPTREMVSDPDLKFLMEQTEIINWMGPSKLSGLAYKWILARLIRQPHHWLLHCKNFLAAQSAVLMCIFFQSGKTEYNLVMSYTAEGSVTKMKNDFESWEPRVQKFLGLVSKTLIWPLLYREPFETWVTPSGKVVLLGDACHPMLVEDAAVLGVLLSHIPSSDELIPLLHGYQTGRSCQPQYFHLEDGPAQRERDRSMRVAIMMEIALDREREISAGELDGNANMWADKKKSQRQFSYDAEPDAEWCISNGLGTSPTVKL
ncbi:hypothetical protein FB451DRAFT_1336955 [Mycena latifolia]|nr:hypothetical protein FB451DRAFT_1336955 [Mycena latifolia]